MVIISTRQGLALAALLAGLTASSAALSQESAPFFDPFDKLDQNRWYVSSGWTNGDHQNCLWHRNRVKVEKGKLRLSLTANAKQGLDFSCGEVQSNNRLGYGTFEARMKVPYARGMNANMFTFIGAPQDRPHNEIDFEFIAPNTPTLQTNFHFKGDSNNEDLTRMRDDGAFHDYAFIWEPGRIRWFIDGELIREETGDGLPNEPQKMYLSIWSTDTLISWMGAFQAESAPQVLEVDWAAYTPIGSACAFDQSVLCQAGVDAP